MSNIFSREGRSVPRPCNFVSFSAAGCGKGRLPASLESLSFRAPYLPAHSSTEEHPKRTLQEGTVYIVCIDGKGHLKYTHVYIHLDTYAIWHGGLG